MSNLIENNGKISNFYYSNKNKWKMLNYCIKNDSFPWFYLNLLQKIKENLNREAKWFN